MLRQALENYFSKRWYEGEAKHWFWSPLSRFYEKQVRKRRQAFLDPAHRQSESQSHAQSDLKLPPVLVVGNITVGGTGKTPLVIYLIEQLAARGLKVAVISRGYGGKAKHYPQQVDNSASPAQVGDEPYMIYQRTGVDIVVDPNRKAALHYLAGRDDYDLVISDDGLQHYALERQYEIVVMDASRELGNGVCLPAGPLREPVDRLASVDAIVINGEPKPQFLGRLKSLNHSPVCMQLQAEKWVSLSGSEQAVDHTEPLDFSQQQSIHAIAAIGNPARFFETLASLGIQTTNHAFPDHHAYTQGELLAFDASLLLMTEKDAEKVRQALPKDQWHRAYYLAMNAVLKEPLIDDILQRISNVR